MYAHRRRGRYGQQLEKQIIRAARPVLIKILLLAVQWETKVVHFPGGQTPDTPTLEPGLLLATAVCERVNSMDVVRLVWEGRVKSVT